jgi:segregation and condensation protein B
MQPLEHIETADTMPEDKPPQTTLPLRTLPSADSNLSPAEALSEGVRRAEAILFAAGEPLSAEQVAEVLPQGVEAAEVLMALRAIYFRRGVNLVEVAGKWRFQTAQDLAFLFVETRQVQKRLSQAALETLAIIAYGQPVTRAEIEAVRGVAVSKAILDILMETGWVKIRGRRRTPGQPLTYGTTAQFLEHFGLESLDTLPGKADLEAEGLLSDVLPSGLAMPDEELLSDDDQLIGEAPDDAYDATFVTQFDAADTDDDAAEAGAYPDSAALTRALDALDFDAEVIAHADNTSPRDDQFTDDFGDDPQDAEGGIVVGFSVPSAPVRTSEEDAEFDRAAVKAAVMKLSRRLRAPPQTDDDWDDET